jgi:membrane protein implicated in regulation of membrane protease activity
MRTGVVLFSAVMGLFAVGDAMPDWSPWAQLSAVGVLGYTCFALLKAFREERVEQRKADLEKDKTQAEALNSLALAITDLRIHCGRKEQS